MALLALPFSTKIKSRFDWSFRSTICSHHSLAQICSTFLMFFVCQLLSWIAKIPIRAEAGRNERMNDDDDEMEMEWNASKGPSLPLSSPEFILLNERLVWCVYISVTVPFHFFFFVKGFHEHILSATLRKQLQISRISVYRSGCSSLWFNLLLSVTLRPLTGHRAFPFQCVLGYWFIVSSIVDWDGCEWRANWQVNWSGDSQRAQIKAMIINELQWFVGGSFMLMKEKLIGQQSIADDGV